jgi:glycosyltransferase involved in cell wall biosynthesis
MISDTPAPLVLGHEYIPTRQPYSANIKELFGATIAHQELLEATLKHIDDIAVHLFYPPQRHGEPTPSTALTALQATYGSSKVLGYYYPDLPGLVRTNKYVMLCGGFLSSQFAQLRSATGATFPICCIQHCCHASSRSVFPEALYSLLASMPGDVLVTTSAAAKQFIDALQETLSSYVWERLNVPVTLRGEIVHLPLGVDVDALAPLNKSMCRDILGISEEKIVLLSVTRIDDEFKADLEPLLITVSRLLRDHEDILLLLAGRDGDPGYGGYIRGVIRNLEISDHVTIVPNFPHFTKRMLYSAADVFVTVSDNVQETFGLALLEAMASGLPIVAPAWSGFRELVSDNVTGFLVPAYWPPESAEFISGSAMFYLDKFAEKHIAQRTVIDLEALLNRIALLVSNSELRHTQGKAARARVRTEFSLTSVIKRYDALWRCQCADASRTSRTESKPLLFNFDCLYRHFANSVFPMDRPLAPTEDCSLLLQRLFRRGQRLPFGLQSAAIVDILEACEAKGRSTRELLEAGIAPKLDIVLWLIKKGYLCPNSALG